MYHRFLSLYRSGQRLQGCSWPDCRALAVAACTAGVVLGLLQFCTFGRVRSLLTWWARPRSSAPYLPTEEENRLLWAVETACRRLLPRESCLTQALTAYALLTRRGARVPELRIGVKRLSDGAISAHAWLEREDTVLIGGDIALREYSRLPTPRQTNVDGEVTSTSLLSGIT